MPGQAAQAMRMQSKQQEQRQQQRQQELQQRQQEFQQRQQEFQQSMAMEQKTLDQQISQQKALMEMRRSELALKAERNTNLQENKAKELELLRLQQQEAKAAREAADQRAEELMDWEKTKWLEGADLRKVQQAAAEAQLTDHRLAQNERALQGMMTAINNLKAMQGPAWAQISRHYNNAIRKKIEPRMRALQEWNKRLAATNIYDGIDKEIQEYVETRDTRSPHPSEMRRGITTHELAGLLEYVSSMSDSSIARKAVEAAVLGRPVEEVVQRPGDRINGDDIYMAYTTLMKMARSTDNPHIGQALLEAANGLRKIKGKQGYSLVQLSDRIASGNHAGLIKAYVDTKVADIKEGLPSKEGDKVQVLVAMAQAFANNPKKQAKYLQQLRGLIQDSDSRFRAEMQARVDELEALINQGPPGVSLYDVLYNTGE